MDAASVFLKSAYPTIIIIGALTAWSSADTFSHHPGSPINHNRDFIQVEPIASPKTACEARGKLNLHDQAACIPNRHIAPLTSEQIDLNRAFTFAQESSPLWQSD
jgi:hypothetical protein